MSIIDNPLNKINATTLLARYGSLISLSDISLFIVNINGDIMFEFVPSPDFCTHICQEKVNRVCEDYLSMFKNGFEGRFMCQYGLENYIHAVRLGDQILGYVAGMQVYTPETEYQKYIIDVQSLTVVKNVELECIAKAIASLKTTETNKLKIHEQICIHIARNIVLDLSESLNIDHHDQDLMRLSIEKEILEKKIIDLEAKNMSLVINPHFVFNTLNSIARIAYFEHSHTIEELIYCLSDLLRYNLKQDDQLHTIASEIDNIEKYLYIQKVRFKSRLEYVIDVPEDVRLRRIPNMVLQPIVENALIHGITPKRDGGKITISAYESDGVIIITIEDNGNGFSQNALGILKHGEHNSGIGYKSTDKRLKRYYGESFGLEIEKSDFSGSTIKVTIPSQQMGRCQL